MTVTLILQNRIDFCGIIVAERCNPNGDPVDGNVPRHDFPGYGVISDVCLKRKIRDRLHDAGHEIFVIQQDRLPDGVKSLNDLVKSVPELREAQKSRNEKEFVRIACEKWLDVRTFGQVFAFKNGENVSTHTRGPVSICEARTIELIEWGAEYITKYVNLNETKKDSGFSSDRMGLRFKVNHGAYVFKGSMYPKLAYLTGFSEDDAEAVKYAMVHMFQHDATASRPSGSIGLHRLYWWRHNCPNGQYSPIRVFRSLHLEASDRYPYYTAELENLPGLEPEIIDGW